VSGDHRPILEARDVRYDYVSSVLSLCRHSTRAIDGVTLRVFKEDVLAIIGESGCGKTTLAKVLLGLEAPTSGEVFLAGKPIRQWSRREIGRRIQVVFQDPYSALNPRHSIGRIVARPLEIHGIGNAAERGRRAREILEVVGLPERLFDTLPGHLSGGQRQRVVIARALVLRPDILVCDEPTSALDVSVQAQILNLLLDLRRDFGLTYLLISHNLAVVEHMATRIGIMYAGRIVEQGDPAEIFGHPRHPYTRALLRSVIVPDPRAGIPEVRMVRDGARERPEAGGCPFYQRCGDAMPVCRDRRPPHDQTSTGFVECHAATAGPAEPGGRVLRLHAEPYSSHREI
jgi:peptide/nickel transport system ATP-binding protein